MPSFNSVSLCIMMLDAIINAVSLCIMMLDAII